MTEVVASISAHGGGRSASGEIVRIQRKYLAMLDGESLGDAVGTSQAAAERLIHAIDDRLDSSSGWGVTVNCRGEGLGLAFGTNARGGGGGALHPCAARVLRGRRLGTLEEALRAVAQIVGRCCG